MYIINNMNEIKPLEETDPELANLFYDIANKKYEYGIKAIQTCNNDCILIPISPLKKISRNDPCWCNSGKKYKKCCGINQ